MRTKFLVASTAGGILLIGGLTLAGIKSPYLADPTFNPDQTARFPAFDPYVASTAKHIIVSGCQLLPQVFNIPGDVSGQTLTNDQSKIENVANFELSKLGITTDRFYSFDYPGTMVLGHVRLIYFALQAPNIKTLVYMNGPEGLGLRNVEAKSALEIVAALKRFAATYPTSAPYAERVRTYVESRSEFQEGLKLYGPQWESLISDDLVLPEAYAESWTQRLAQLPHIFQRRLADILGAPAGLLHQAMLRFTPFAKLREEERAVSIAELTRESHSYEREIKFPITPIMWDPAQNPIFADEPEVYKAWFLMVAEAARQRGVRLALYSAPHASIKVEDMATYGTMYFDQVKRWLAGYDVFVIDNTDSKTPVSGYVYHCQGDGCQNNKNIMTDGYHLNMIGRRDQARLLVKSMIDQKVIVNE